MEELNLPILNLDQTRSRIHYNCYRASYNSMYEPYISLKPEIIVETYVALLPFPTTTRMVDNYIYRFLNKINRLDLAEVYDLRPFPITTQAIERTLVDKVFALCDYYMKGKVERHSRHLYDIHQIVSSIGFSKEVANLIPEVREVRAELPICPSAKSDVSIQELLCEIVDSDVYKNDYNNITQGLLFVPVSYEVVIQSLKDFANSGIWS